MTEPEEGTTVSRMESATSPVCEFIQYPCYSYSHSGTIASLGHRGRGLSFAPSLLCNTTGRPFLARSSTNTLRNPMIPTPVKPFYWALLTARFTSRLSTWIKFARSSPSFSGYSRSVWTTKVSRRPTPPVNSGRNVPVSHSNRVVFPSDIESSTKTSEVSTFRTALFRVGTLLA